MWGSHGSILPIPSFSFCAIIVIHFSLYMCHKYTIHCYYFCWRSSSRGHDHCLTLQLDQSNQRLLTFTQSLQCTFCPLFPWLKLFSRAQPWKDNGCWDHLDSRGDWTQLQPLYKLKILVGELRDLVLWPPKQDRLVI